REQLRVAQGGMDDRDAAERVADDQRPTTVEHVEQIGGVDGDIRRLVGRADRLPIAPAVVEDHVALVGEEGSHPPERAAPIEHTMHEDHQLVAGSLLEDMEVGADARHRSVSLAHDGPVTEGTRTMITDEMRGIVGKVMATATSFPISESDIRKWAVAVYFPEV